MPLKFIVQKLEDVEEAQRGFYKQRADGKFQLDAEDAEDVAGLKSALQQERQEALEMKKRLDALNKNELAELKRLKKIADDAERERLEKEGNFEAVKNQMIAKHNEELQAAREAASQVRSKLERVMLNDAATQAIVNAKGNPKLLGPIVRSAMQLVEMNGDLVVQVVGADGRPLVSDAKGSPMSIEQYVESLKTIPDYQPAFAATSAGGGGAPASGASADPATKPLSKWTPEEKREFIQKNGTEAYRDLVMSQRAA